MHRINNIMTEQQLIIDSPRHHQRQRRSVQFAEISQLYTFERYEDSNGMSVAPHELWYTSPEYARMKRAVMEAVLQVRQRAMAALSYSAGSTHDQDSSPEAEEESSLSDCIGIEHLITRASMHEVRTCRARCTHAVLEEQQARQMNDPSASLRFRWDAIALSSLAHTRRTALRARMLGNMHRDSI
mmetsp:Transcript_11267/g.14397  ORF Transcript_11267/g.14397 Transcript_11267/m.14397 type:complete len:185 (+) Transcript_11267:69-623(+)